MSIDYELSTSGIKPKDLLEQVVELWNLGNPGLVQLRESSNGFVYTEDDYIFINDDYLLVSGYQEDPLRIDHLNIGNFNVYVYLAPRRSPIFSSREDVIRLYSRYFTATKRDGIAITNGETVLMYQSKGELTINTSKDVWLPEYAAHVEGAYKEAEIAVL
jgi:hypothetical protein